MLRTIEMYTNEYKDTTQKEIRKKKGQFFLIIWGNRNPSKYESGFDSQ